MVDDKQRRQRMGGRGLEGLYGDQVLIYRCWVRQRVKEPKNKERKGEKKGEKKKEQKMEKNEKIFFLTKHVLGDDIKKNEKR